MPQRTREDDVPSPRKAGEPLASPSAPHRRTPHGVPTEFPAEVGDYEPPDPARTDRDAETKRMWRVIVFVILLASLGLVPAIALLLRLAR